MLDQTKVFTLIRKGGPSPYPENLVANDGGYFHLDKERADLSVFLENPTEKEIFDYINGRAKFGLYVSESVIFLLHKFGDQPWCDTPYSANLVPLALRGMPSGYEPGMRILLNVMLINSKTNIVWGLRMLTLSVQLSEILAKLIKKQIEFPVSRTTYDKAIADAYVKHPTPASMKREAIIISSDRWAEVTQTPEQVNAQSQSSSESKSGAEALIPQPELLDHITLNTGHSRLSPRGEAGQLAVEVCRELIELSLASNDYVPIRACEPYVVKILIDGSNLVATVSERVAGTLSPLVTMGVAIDADSGIGLWEEMHSSANMALVTRAESPPSQPWIAARLEMKRTFFSALAAMLWIGDFERCLAFAFVDYLSKKQAQKR